MAAKPLNVLAATAVVSGGILLAIAAAPQMSRAASARVEFTRDIQPILKAHCYACHGSERQEAALRLDSKALAMKGGLSGETICAGKSRQSLLVKRVLGQEAKPRMPRGQAALSDKQIALIRGWID